MERFLKFFKFKIAPIFFSVVILVSLPLSSFPSHALGLGATYSAAEMLVYLTSYFVSHGYSAPRIAGDPDNTYVGNAGNPVIEDFIDSFISTLKVANSAQGEAIEYALKRACSSGVFSISSETDSFLKSYLANNTIDSDIILGNSTNILYPIEANQSVDFSFQLTQPSVVNSPVYSASITYKVPYKCLPFVFLSYNSYGILEGFALYFLPTERVDLSMQQNGYFTGASTTFVTDANLATPSDPNPRSFDTNNRYLYATFSVWGSDYQILGSTLPSILTSTVATESEARSIYEYLILNGYYDNSQDLTSTQIYDTSDSDILSSASEVDPDTGAVSGGFTFYMRDLSLFQQIIKQFSENVISWTTALKALGLSSVSNTATVSEKEAALDKVSYPDSTYDWFSSTTWGETVTQSVNDELDTAISQEQSLSDSVAEDLASGSGQSPSDEDLDRAGQSMLLATLLMWLGIWKPPSFDPDNPDPGGVDSSSSDEDDFDSSDYLGDTLSGVAVVSGFITDIFDSAGGSSGFGIIFTVGATFVIFSVLIGAANYFGVNDVQTTSVTVQKPPKIKRLALPDKKGK